MKRLFLLAAFLFACAIGVDARAQVVLSGQVERIDLWPHVRVLPEKEGKLRFEQAQAMTGQFTTPVSAYATLGMGKEAVWLRVPFQVGAGGHGEWVLDFDYALLRQVDVYFAIAGQRPRHIALGTAPPFAERPLRGRTHAVALELPAGGQGELLIRVDTRGGKILPMSLSRLPAFHSRGLLEQLLQGALGALGAFLIIFSVGQWIHLREHIYLKYAFLVTFSALFSVHFFGIGEMYLWTNNEWVQARMAGITSLLAASATALFVEDALAGDLHRYLRRGLRAVAGLHVLAAIAHAMLWIDIQAVAIMMSTTGLAPALMGLPGAVAKARRGDSVGLWFMFAWVGYFIASATLVGVVRGRVDATDLTLHSFQIGTTLDMLIFLRIALLRTAARHDEARRAAEDRDAMHSLAHSDPLTGLLNRRGLAEALTVALARTSPERMVAVYVLDLDGFKAVNDQFGHDTGDALLRVVAQRLRGSVRSGDEVARLGGDEFVVVANGLANVAQASDLGQKLLEAFRTPFALPKQTCTIGATFGYAVAPEDGRDAAEMLKAADAAMYAGKQAGKDRVVRMGAQPALP